MFKYISFLNSAASIFGSAALAAMGIVNKIYTITTQMVCGFNNAYLPFASFNVGAKRYDRVKESNEVTEKEYLVG